MESQDLAFLSYQNSDYSEISQIPEIPENTQYSHVEVFGEEAKVEINDSELKREQEIADLKREVQSLKEMYGNVGVAVEQQKEKIGLVEDDLNRIMGGNDFVELELEKQESWGDFLRKNKMVVGAITAVSTLAVVVPAALTLLLKKPEESPNSGNLEKPNSNN